MDKLTTIKSVAEAKEFVKNAGLYLVTQKDIQKLAEVSVDAYQDYPLHNWFCGGIYDAKVSKLVMEISLKTMLSKGVIYADSSDINGFTIWMPPNFKGSKTIPFLANGGFELIKHSGFGIIGRLLKYETYAMSLKKKFTNHQDWYAYNLSVLKKEQGKGIASKLLNPILKFSDSTQNICYLETNKESNVPLYQHFGFELVEKNYIPGTNVMHYAMVRKPKIK